MINGIAGQHVTTAEQYLIEVERAFPNLSIEAKERLALADTHLRVALAYQLQSLEEAIKTLDLGGIDLGGAVIPFSPSMSKAPPPRRPWWQFWK